MSKSSWLSKILSCGAGSRPEAGQLPPPVHPDVQARAQQIKRGDQVVSFRGIPLTEKQDVEALAHALSTPSTKKRLYRHYGNGNVNNDLWELDLAGCALTDLNLTIITVALTNNDSLKAINLSHNQLTDVGAEVFAEHLVNHSHLTSTDFSSNPGISPYKKAELDELTKCHVEGMSAIGNLPYQPKWNNAAPVYYGQGASAAAAERPAASGAEGQPNPPRPRSPLEHASRAEGAAAGRG